MTLKILYWFTRVLAILAILLMLMFSLDAFGGEEPVGKQILGFLLHSIPVLILICALVIAWKHEIFGGLIFILLTAALAVLWHSFTGNPGSLIILAPFFLIGLLFILNGVLSRRKDITE